MDSNDTRHVPRVAQIVTRMNIGGPARAVIELAKGLPQIPGPGSMSDTYEHHAYKGNAREHGIHGHSADGHSTYEVIVAAGNPPPEEGVMSDLEVPVLYLPLVRQISPASDYRSLLATRRLLASLPSKSLPYPTTVAPSTCVALDTSAPRPTGPPISSTSISDTFALDTISTHQDEDGPLPAVAYRPTAFPSGPFDLVNTHMAKAGTLGRMAALSLRSRPILVHTFHGHVLEGYFPSLPSKALILLERALALKTDALVAVSSEIRDELLTLGIGKPQQWHVIPLGLDLGGYLSIPLPGDTGPNAPDLKWSLRNSLSIPPGAPLLAIIGRLVPVKDHSTVLRAMATRTLSPGTSYAGNPSTADPSIYDPSTPTSSAGGPCTGGPCADGPAAVHLLVVGDGEMRNKLEEEARELGVANRVHFLGWQKNIPDILAEVDVVILASLKEGTPAVLIEAAAAGRPVVSSDVGGVRSIVMHRETGLLVPPSDPAEMALSIRSLVNNPQLRRSLGARARQVAEDRFGAQRFVQDTAALYANLLSTRSTGKG
ncbi:MAG: glycosyltransferase [Acidimicrobiales bacterium]